MTCLQKTLIVLNGQESRNPIIPYLGRETDLILIYIVVMFLLIFGEFITILTKNKNQLCFPTSSIHILTDKN